MTSKASNSVPTSVSDKALRNALYALPADDRETWVTMAMALKSELGEDGYSLWNEWSRQATDPTHGYIAADAKAVWRSCKPTGGITIATLYHLAKSHGWQGDAPVVTPPDPEEQRRRAELAAAEEAKRWRAAKRATQVATRMLQDAEVGPHPYLAAKGFPEAQGLVISKDNLLLVPMRSFKTGALQSLQTINTEGQKKFLTGSKVKGAVHKLGRAWTSWYCEGYATGLSVQAALRRLYRQDQVVVCFSAGNLAHVASTRGSTHRPRYVVADNDESGTGEKYAHRTGLSYWIPPELGDANDFHHAYGIEALTEGLREVLSE